MPVKNCCPKLAYPEMETPRTLDLLSTTATELQALLQAGKTSSVQLVEAYWDQIAKYDLALKAFICIAPRQDVISRAALLDQERLDGGVRSQLHGIPVVLKVREAPKNRNYRLVIGSNVLRRIVSSLLMTSGCQPRLARGPLLVPQAPQIPPWLRRCSMPGSS